MLAGTLSSCQPTYPARTLTNQLVKLSKEEENIQVTAHITGKTLWTYIPLDNLINKETMGWNEEGIEKMSRILSIVHRVILSTDAKLDFAATVANDIKNYGVQLTTYEYLPDIREAILEKFSRGEFFMRSIKDVTINTASIGDISGESIQYHDINFDYFLGLQVIHRAKNLFAKDKTLSKIFDLRSTSLSDKFGIIKIDFEFIQKLYVLTDEEKKIKPLDYVKMLVADMVRGYDYKDFQAFEIKDTFSGESMRLDAKALKEVKINLPEFKE